MENTNINPLAENAFLQQRLGLEVTYAQEETGASVRVCVCARTCVCVRVRTRTCVWGRPTRIGRSSIKWVGESPDFEITHFC